MSTDYAAAPEKMKRIIQELADKAAKLDWQPTADDETFLVSLPTHSISLRRLTRWDRPKRYAIGVLDSAGRELDSYLVEPTDPLNHQVADIYGHARNAALRVEEGLGEALKELEST